MNVRAHEIAERGVHGLMALAGALSTKGFCHDENTKVSAATCARVPGVRGTVIHDFEMLGRELTRERGADPFDSVHRHCTPELSGDSG